MNVPPRRKPIRLPAFDYASEGAYFVTLVTQSRECLFGEIIYDEMVLSEFGRIVTDEWERSTLIRTEIQLGAYVVMPNHFHGIVHIFQNVVTVGAYGHTPLHETKYSNTKNEFCSPSHTLGAMVRGFKSSVTTRINTLRGTPGVPVWQRNYYDHIIRSERSYTAVEQYIQDNPQRWAADKENR